MLACFRLCAAEALGLCCCTGEIRSVTELMVAMLIVVWWGAARWCRHTLLWVARELLKPTWHVFVLGSVSVALLLRWTYEINQEDLRDLSITVCFLASFWRDVCVWVDVHESLIPLLLHKWLCRKARSYGLCVCACSQIAVLLLTFPCSPSTCPPALPGCV